MLEFESWKGAYKSSSLTHSFSGEELSRPEMMICQLLAKAGFESRYSDFPIQYFFFSIYFSYVPHKLSSSFIIFKFSFLPARLCTVICDTLSIFCHWFLGYPSAFLVPPPPQPKSTHPSTLWIYQGWSLLAFLENDPSCLYLCCLLSSCPSTPTPFSVAILLFLMAFH